MWSQADSPSHLAAGHARPNVAGPRAASADAGIVARIGGGLVSALIVALFTTIAAITRPGIRRFLLAAIVLNIPLSFGVHLNYREDVGDLGSLGGWALSPTTIALAGLYLGILFALPRGGVRAAMSSIKISAPLAWYLFFCCVSVLAAPDFTLALFEVFALFQFFLMYLYVSNAVSSEADILFVIRLVLIGLILEGVLSIALVSGWSGVKFLGLQTRLDQTGDLGLNRFGGTLGSPNDAAAYLVLALAVAMGIALTSLGRKYRWLGIGALVSGFAALILTFSRGGWIAFVVSFAIIGVFAGRGRISWKIPVLGAVFALAVALLLGSAIEQRLSKDDKGAAYSRVPLMKIAVQMIEDHPLLGVGANNFPVAMQPYVTRGFLGEFIYTVHNKYLLIWSETGVGALVAFVWFLIATIRQGLHCWKRRNPLFSPLALAFTAGIAGHMTHMMSDFFRGGPSQQLLWLMAAMVISLDRAAQDHPSGGPAFATRNVLALNS